jgi:hypothetical protein
LELSHEVIKLGIDVCDALVDDEGLTRVGETSEAPAEVGLPIIKPKSQNVEGSWE